WLFDYQWPAFRLAGTRYILCAFVGLARACQRVANRRRLPVLLQRSARHRGDGLLSRRGTCRQRRTPANIGLTWSWAFPQQACAQQVVRHGRNIFASRVRPAFVIRQGFQPRRSLYSIKTRAPRMAPVFWSGVVGPWAKYPGHTFCRSRRRSCRRIVAGRPTMAHTMTEWTRTLLSGHRLLASQDADEVRTRVAQLLNDHVLEPRGSTLAARLNGVQADALGLWMLEYGEAVTVEETRPNGEFLLAQLPLTGSVTVECEEGCWTVGAGSGLIMPSQVPHRLEWEAGA